MFNNQLLPIAISAHTPFNNTFARKSWVWIHDVSYKKLTTCQQKKTINYTFIALLINNAIKFYIRANIVGMLTFTNKSFKRLIMDDYKFKIMNDLYGSLSEIRDKNSEKSGESNKSKGGKNE